MHSIKVHLKYITKILISVNTYTKSLVSFLGHMQTPQNADHGHHFLLTECSIQNVDLMNTNALDSV